MLPLRLCCRCRSPLPLLPLRPLRRLSHHEQGIRRRRSVECRRRCRPSFFFILTQHVLLVCTRGYSCPLWHHTLAQTNISQFAYLIRLSQIVSSILTLGSHGRLPRSALTVGSHTRLPRSALTLASHARLPRSPPTVGSHARLPRSPLTLGSHARLPHPTAVGSHTRLSCAPPTLASHGRLSRSAPTLDSHARLPRSAPTVGSHDRLSRSALHTRLPRLAPTVGRVDSCRRRWPVDGDGNRHGNAAAALCHHQPPLPLPLLRKLLLFPAAASAVAAAAAAPPRSCRRQEPSMVSAGAARKGGYGKCVRPQVRNSCAARRRWDTWCVFDDCANFHLDAQPCRRSMSSTAGWWPARRREHASRHWPMPMVSLAAMPQISAPPAAARELRTRRTAQKDPADG